MIIEETLIQTLIERSIFEAMRLELVAKGYLPDIEDYANRGEYESALNALGLGGFAIEVFGSSTSQDKGLKRVPRIVIVPGKMIPGEIGLEFSPIYEANKDVDGNIVDWVKKRHTYETGNFEFDIHLISNTTTQNRVLNHILNLVLGPRKFLSIYNEPDTRFFVEQLTYYNQPDTYEGLNEVVYTYQAKDLYLHDGISIGTVSKILQIDLEITPNGQGVFGGLLPTEVHTAKINPYMLTEIRYQHEGAESGTTNIIPGIGAAEFVKVLRGSQPIYLYDGADPIPGGYYRIDIPNNKILISPQIKAGEVLNILMQL